MSVLGLHPIWMDVESEQKISLEMKTVHRKVCGKSRLTLFLETRVAKEFLYLQCFVDKRKCFCNLGEGTPYNISRKS